MFPSRFLSSTHSVTWLTPSFTNNTRRLLLFRVVCTSLEWTLMDPFFSVTLFSLYFLWPPVFAPYMTSWRPGLECDCNSRWYPDHYKRGRSRWSGTWLHNICNYMHSWSRPAAIDCFTIAFPYDAFPFLAPLPACRALNSALGTSCTERSLAI